MKLTEHLLYLRQRNVKVDNEDKILRKRGLTKKEIDLIGKIFKKDLLTYEIITLENTQIKITEGFGYVNYSYQSRIGVGWIIERGHNSEIEFPYEYELGASSGYELNSFFHEMYHVYEFQTDSQKLYEEGEVYLVRLKKLEKLYIFGTKITEKGLKQLKKLNNLIYLSN